MNILFFFIFILEKFLRPIYESLMAQLVKNLPAVRETWVQSLGQADPLEKGMVTPSSILAWRIPWTGAWWFLCPWGYKELNTTDQLTHTHE